MNKDVLSAIGGPDKAVTLCSREVLTHTLEHWTRVSTHRSAKKDRKVLRFVQKGEDSDSKELRSAGVFQHQPGKKTHAE